MDAIIHGVKSVEICEIKKFKRDDGTIFFCQEIHIKSERHGKEEISLFADSMDKLIKVK